ncbi:MAG: trigger factor [Deltaproteobacteria bacterium]
MRFEVENIGAVKRKISVEVPAETVNSEIEAAYSKLKNQVKIDGFRKGKVPRSILERYYKGHVEYDVASKLINDGFNKVLSERDIYPVSEPEVEPEPFVAGSAFKFTATVEVRPEVGIKGYDGLKIMKEKVSVTDKMVDESIDAIRKQRMTLNDVDGPLKNGDTAIIDFEGFINGAPFKGGKGEAAPLKIGDGKFIPGFEEQLVGLSVGADKELRVRFPDDYGHKEFAGKDATFKVRVKGVKEEILPAADDEFAKDLGFETLDKLKAKVRDGIEKDEEARIKAKMREQVMDSLIATNQFDVPQSMVSKQRDFLLEELKKKYKRAGREIDKEIQQGPALAEDLEKRALQQVKGAMILMEIANKEGLKVTDSDLDERFSYMAAETNIDVAEVKSYYEKNKLMDAIRREILDDKIFDFVTSRANVVEK